MAFVTHWYYVGSNDMHYNSTWMRLCPSLMASQDPMEVGFVIYHELIHMVSWVSDSDLGYSKGALVGLADSYPAEARQSANNYMLYAAQNGLSYDDYASVSSSWGSNHFSPDCKDMYSNCLDFAVDCCGDKFTNGWNGSLLASDCCASCTLFDSTEECIAINGHAPI